MYIQECPVGYVVGDTGNCEVIYEEIESDRIPSGGLLSCGADGGGGGRIDGGSTVLKNTWPWLVRIGIAGSGNCLEHFFPIFLRISSIFIIVCETI